MAASRPVKRKRASSAPYKTVSKRPRTVRPKPKAKKKHMPMTLARAQYLYNPFVQKGPPQDGGEGNAVFLTNRIHLEVLGSTTQKQFLLLFPSAAYSVPGAIWNSDGSYSASIINMALFNSPPMTQRPLRCGIKLTNVTRADAVEGQIRVLISTQPLDLEFADATTGNLSTAFMTALDGMLDASPHTKTYSAHHFANGCTFVAPPATRSGYQENKIFSVTGGMPGYRAAWLGCPTKYGTRHCHH